MPKLIKEVLVNQRLLNEYLDFALELTQVVNSAVMSHYRNCKISLKKDESEVTIADKATELKILDRIQNRYPEHSIVGEEFGEVQSKSNDFTWVVDPIDGTTWFSLGVPIFGTLIALLYKTEPIVGVIYYPVLNETIFAGKGLGCWFSKNDQTKSRLQISNNALLPDAFVSASGIHASNINPIQESHKYNLADVIRSAKKFRFCGDCLQHSLVCMGSLNAAIDTKMKLWDIAAIIPCIEEAGGIVTDLQGNRDNIFNTDSLLSSSNIIIHNEILRIINS